MCRGTFSPTLTRGIEFNKSSEPGRQGCVRMSFIVGRVGQTPRASDNHMLLRACPHTWCTAEAQKQREEKGCQSGSQGSIPSHSTLVRTVVPIPGWMAESPGKLSERADSWGPTAVPPSQNHVGWGNWGMRVFNKLPWDSHTTSPFLSLELPDPHGVPCKLVLLLFKATGRPPKTDPGPSTWNGRARSTPREAPCSLSTLLALSATAGDHLGGTDFRYPIGPLL